MPDVKFCKEELEVFCDHATLTCIRANSSQCTSRDPWLCYHQPDRACLGVSRHEGGPSCPAPKQCSRFFMGSLQMATCPCSAAGSESHAPSLGLVDNACGCSPSSLASLKRTCGVAFCCCYAISTSATNLLRKTKPSATELPSRQHVASVR